MTTQFLFQTVIVGSYLIAHGFFSVYGMCVDTLFLCFCKCLARSVYCWAGVCGSKTSLPLGLNPRVVQIWGLLQIPVASLCGFSPAFSFADSYLRSYQHLLPPCLLAVETQSLSLGLLRSLLIFLFWCFGLGGT